MSGKRRNPKCSYCRGSKLTDAEFELVLACFLTGTTAEYAKQKLQEKLPEQVPRSEKTIRRHFLRIGEAVYQRVIENHILERSPGFAELRSSDPQKAERMMRSVCDGFHTQMLDDEKYRALGTSTDAQDAVHAYRLFSNVKYGTRIHARHYIALAHLWASFRKLANEDKVAGYDLPDWVFLAIFYWTRDSLKAKPC